MKRRFVKSPLKIVLGLTLVVAGCARFGHQTSESEPHGVLRFASSSDRYEEQVAVKTFDGLPVSAERDYRVRPGRHELVYRVVERAVETYDPNFLGAGKTPDKPADPAAAPAGSTNVTAAAGRRAAGASVVRRRTRYLTNSISIDAGWLYEVDGENVSKTRLEPQKWSGGVFSSGLAGRLTK
jgi:hypothetical protein